LSGASFISDLLQLEVDVESRLFRIRDRTGQVLGLPFDFPEFPRQTGKEASKNLRGWRDVLQLIVKLYLGYVEFGLTLVRCEEALACNNSDRAEKLKEQARDYLRGLISLIKEFGRELDALPGTVAQAPSISVLRRFPLCCEVIIKDLQSPVKNRAVANARKLAEEMSWWLLEALRQVTEITSVR